jgi:hypothetical protein
MEFVRVPAGRFTMGSPPGEPGREDQERPHEVAISRAFLLGRFEVTQRQWRAVMNADPSWFHGDDERPVERVTWTDVQAFLRRLAARSPGSVFRLPTEAEWEYAGDPRRELVLRGRQRAVRAALHASAWASASCGSRVLVDSARLRKVASQPDRKRPMPRPGNEWLSPASS